MANIMVNEDDRRKPRTITLSNNEVFEITRITGNDSLTRGIRDMLLILKDIEGADPELIVKIRDIE